MNKSDHNWGIYKGNMDGKSYSMRVNDVDYKDMSKNYFYKVGIAVPFNWTTETGMPSRVELESLNGIEDYLFKVIRSDKDIMVAVVTGNNVEEFIFYTSDPESFAELYKKKIQSYITDHKSQFYYKEDKNWDTYLALKGK